MKVTKVKKGLWMSTAGLLIGCIAVVFVVPLSAKLEYGYRLMRADGGMYYSMDGTWNDTDKDGNPNLRQVEEWSDNDRYSDGVGPLSQYIVYETCTVCRGTGKNICQRCNGRGCQQCKLSGFVYKACGGLLEGFDALANFSGVSQESGYQEDDMLIGRSLKCCECDGKGKFMHDSRFKGWEYIVRNGDEFYKKGTEYTEVSHKYGGKILRKITQKQYNEEEKAIKIKKAEEAAKAAEAKRVQDSIAAEAKRVQDSIAAEAKRVQDSIKSVQAQVEAERIKKLESYNYTGRTVKIGKQTWMAENLNNEYGGKCYDDNPSNCAAYGRLYSWDEAKIACPVGYHLPSKEEWTILTEYAGGRSRSNGKRLKSKTGWKESKGKTSYGKYDNSGTDKYGFSALPGGAYTGERYGFSGLGESGTWWSATEDYSDGILIWDVDYNSSVFVRSSGVETGVEALYSVRCIQDVGFVPAPTPTPAQQVQQSAQAPTPAPAPQVQAAVPSAPSSLLDSRDGRNYRVIQAGTQAWMAENLNYNADGSKQYNNESANGDKYGKLYDWSTAASACPAGWRLPSTADWKALVDYAGGKSKAGTKLKSSAGWGKVDGVSSGTDAYGFSALPGGYFGNDYEELELEGATKPEFRNAGNNGYWWSATKKGANSAYYINMSNDGESVDRGEGDIDKFLLYSVRCMQDVEPAQQVVQQSAPAPTPTPEPQVQQTAPVESASAPTPAPKPKRESVNSMSFGGGLFFANDFGGGILWDNDEVLAMPYYGIGAYLYFDAIYAEVFGGFSLGGGKWESGDVSSPSNLPNMERTYLNIGVFGKYPFGSGRVRYFPLLGIDYEASVSGRLVYDNGAEYEFDGARASTDAGALSALWVKFGGGVDIDWSQNFYFRAELLYGLRTANDFEKINAGYSSYGGTPRQGSGMTLKAGLGYKF